MVRVSARRVVSAAALGLIDMLVGGSLALANAYMPLGGGSAAGPGPTHAGRGGRPR